MQTAKHQLKLINFDQWHHGIHPSFPLVWYFAAQQSCRQQPEQPPTVPKWFAGCPVEWSMWLVLAAVRQFADSSVSHAHIPFFNSALNCQEPNWARKPPWNCIPYRRTGLWWVLACHRMLYWVPVRSSLFGKSFSHLIGLSQLIVFFLKVPPYLTVCTENTRTCGNKQHTAFWSMWA